MTLEESALRIAIVTEPDDDTPRLVYADWLQENGQEERAEFIRLQCELSRLEARHLPADDPCTCMRTDESFRAYQGGVFCGACRRRNEPIEQLKSRERELFRILTGDGVRHGRDVWGLLPDWVWTLEPSGGEPNGIFRRGFVSEVRFSADLWIAHADSLHWHPAQMMECNLPHDPKLDLDNRLDYKPHSGCSHCKGTGRIPRPWPPTAQPITHITITTRPEGHWEGESASDEVIFHLDGYTRTIRESEVLAHREAKGTWDGTPHTMKDVLTTFWPRLTFTLPPEPIPHA